jgi:hypothetical protein
MLEEEEEKAKSRNIMYVNIMGYVFYYCNGACAIQLAVECTLSMLIQLP